MNEKVNALVNTKERIFSIDVMRGFSILGIFLFNIYSFHVPYLYVDPVSLAERQIDYWVFSFVDIFVQASFYPLFAILFGYGLFLLKERTELRGQNFTPIALRRMSILLIVGILHAFFIWSGDILITYAVLGFLLIPMLNVSARVLLIVACLAYFIPGILLLGLMALTVMLTAGMEFTPYLPGAEHVTNIFQNGSFIEITKQRISDWMATNVDAAIILFFTVFPLLLLGAFFAKTKLLQYSERNSAIMKRVLFISLPVGLFLKTLPYFWTNNLVTQLLQDQFGGVALTLGYIAIIYFLANSSILKRVWQLFSNVGRMSLTNYLSQSIICSFIFYSYGLGLFGKVTYTTSTLLAIGIFILQIIFSHFWLKSFKMGPFEWGWRGLTYGKFIPLKK